MTTAAQTFYRVLHTQQHIDDWKDGHFHSYHPALPGEWIQLYYNQERSDTGAYSLDISWGRMTQKALDSFLALAPTYAHGATWSDQHLKAAGELAGVCCFDNLQSAIEWANSQDQDVPIVEFKGVAIRRVFEDNGWIASVSKTTQCQLCSVWKKQAKSD